MTISNTGYYSYVSIVPIKAKFNDSRSSTKISISSVSDNMIDRAIISYSLIMPQVDEVRDESDNITVYGISEQVSMNGAAELVGSDYISWGTDGDYPYTYLMRILELTEN